MKQKLVYIGVPLIALLLAGCGGSSAELAASSTPAEAPAPAESYAGKYAGSGGGGAIPQVQALINGFGHTEMTWVLQDTGSDASISLVQNGTVDLGFVSRDLKPDELSRVKQLPIGAVGTGVAVSASNPVTDLSSAQIKGIFSGEITDWSQVGGKPGRIKVFLREKVAATRTNFESYFFGGKPTYPADAIEVFEIDEMISSLQSFSGGIGMVSISNQTLTSPFVHLVGIDGVAVTKENVLSGAYKVRRPLYLIWNTDPSALTPGVQAFIEFVQGPQGQQVMLRAGF